MRHLPLLLSAVLCLASCVDAPAGKAQVAPALAEGRHLFASRCARCHALPDPIQCNAVVMDGMAPQAGLTPHERSAVEAYLASVKK